MKKLKNKDVFDSWAGFAVYFTFIFIVGGIFTGLKELGGPNADYWNCNYLYMFNKEETTKIVGFVAPFFDMKIKLFNFFTVSVIQFVILIAFTAICTGAFYVLKALLNMERKPKKEIEQDESTMQ